jgi:3-oxoadipate enol-lactonase
MASRAIAVHHEIAGPPGAPALVLSGSLGSALAMWDPQMEALTRDFRVLRYDLRGHGQSPVPPGPYDMADLGADLLALLDRSGIGRAHLCGLSMGGMVSLWTAAHHPERVDRLVVLSTSALLGPPQMWIDRAAIVRERGTASIADAVVARWFTARLRASDPALVERTRAMIAATPAAGYAACCGAIERMDLRPDLGAIAAPTLAIAAADDPSTPAAHLARIADGIAGCRLVVVAEAAHLVNVEQPEKVNALIRTHLQPATAASIGEERSP